MVMLEILQKRTAGTTPCLRRDLLTSAAAILVAGLWPQRASATDVQKEWASCAKCRTIYFDGFSNKGHCAAGGAHSSGQTRVQLPFNTSTGPRAQDNWHFCNKCNALFFNGFSDKGVCPGGDGGHRAQGINFVLTHSVPENFTGFRFCSKCHALFQPGQGRCPKGENHAAAGFIFFLNDEKSQIID
jgi:hypothetical protein